MTDHETTVPGSDSDSGATPRDLSPISPLEEVADVPEGSVVIGIDGSVASDAALAWGAREAASRGLPVHLLCARESYALPTASVEGTIPWEVVLDDGGDAMLTRARGHALEVAPDVEITCSRPWGGAAQVLVAASERASFVVVGTRGRGRKTAAILGTVSLQTASHARCPVVVIRGDRSEDARTHGSARVVVGVDGSRDSERALRFAFDCASPAGRVTALKSWWLEVVDGVVVTTPESPAWERVVAGHEAKVRAAIGDLPAQHPEVSVEVRVERAPASELLIEASKSADLLVVGSRGRGGFAGLMLGSVSQHMLTGAECPVAVVSRLRH
ncbi:universal stress protein [Mobilicoccus sp.]|uniref:universal stress protein n=1 Tax=Mobilicoccus sp. TaxID=2034349 RepID=UPI0028AC72A5|nr:universal stress protein [Mobilicoccus sp.]